MAPKHLQAISATGNRLLAALDPHDSVGILDSHFPQASFFTEYERFDRYLEKLRKSCDQAICSPNYLHDAQARLALRIGAHAICEKPLVITPWNLDQLKELEQDSGKRVHAILQLRFHPSVLALRQGLADHVVRSKVVLTCSSANLSCDFLESLGGR